MNEVTQILHAVHAGDQHAARELISLVYAELRKLAAHRLAQEKAGQTLQPTALVHEAYLRLVDVEQRQAWNSSGHFFAAAAEAMRRILVESARRRKQIKRGGDVEREALDSSQLVAPEVSDDLLDLDAALDKLEREDPQAAHLVKLRYFSGLTIPQAAEILSISPRKADFLWSFARAWLRRELAGA